MSVSVIKDEHGNVTSVAISCFEDEPEPQKPIGYVSAAALALLQQGKKAMISGAADEYHNQPIYAKLP